MNEAPIGFRFVGIQILSKSMPPAPSAEVGANNSYSFTILVEVKTDETTQMVCPVVHIKIINGENPEHDAVLASFIVAYYFQIEDFGSVIVKNADGAFVIPTQLDNIIKPAAISTTRGIIFTELRGTYLQNAIMPIVFMDNFQFGDPPGFK